jgi:ABC-type multidrug transport system ATPase subunit
MTSEKAGFCTSCRSLVGGDDEKSCPDCAAPLVMLQDEVPKKSEQESAPPIEPSGHRVTLLPDLDVSFGTHNDCSHRLSDPMISGFQASVVYRQVDEACWITDYGTHPRTWVNRDPVKSRKLKYGDLVQVGSAAWTYLQVDEKAQLEPVTCVEGASVEYYQHRDQQQREKVLEIKPGKFVAVIGASGSGKSTLLKTLIGKDVPDDVQIIIGDGEKWIDVNSSSDALHKVLGYVSQEKFIHDALSAREVLYQAVSFADPHLRFLDAFAGGIKKCEKKISEALLQLGVPEQTKDGKNRWDLELCRISGGEQQRVRTAHELIRKPKLLLLDEPGSGLGLEHEQSLMLRLKHLSHCGITVVLVLHNLPMVKYCDHFFRIDITKEGVQVTHQGAGEDFDPYCRYKSLPPTSQSLGVFHRSMVEAKLGKSPTTGLETGRAFGRRLSQWWTQGGMLLRREFKLSAKPQQSPKREKDSGVLHRCIKAIFQPLMFWLLWMPLAFALIIGVSVSDRYLLGFLSVMAVIWMGASLAVRRIVDERKIFEHEHLIFLRATPYVLAKFVCYSLLAIPQTIVYVTLLYFIRDFYTLDFFFQASDFPGVVFVVVWALLPVTLAGVGAGLFISAIADHDRNRPNQFLPILMVCQIIFSATIMDEPKMGLLTKTDEFHAHQCEVHEDLRAKKHDVESSLWLCRECERELRRLRKEMATIPGGENLVRKLEDLTEGKTVTRTVDEIQRNEARRWGVRISYLMISRWGDLALHSTAIQREQGEKQVVKYLTAYGDNFEVSKEENSDPNEVKKKRLNPVFVDGVRSHSRRILFGIYLGLIFSTIWVLKLQVRRKPKPDPEND